MLSATNIYKELVGFEVDADKLMQISKSINSIVSPTHVGYRGELHYVTAHGGGAKLFNCNNNLGTLNLFEIGRYKFFINMSQTYRSNINGLLGNKTFVFNDDELDDESIKRITDKLKKLNKTKYSATTVHIINDKVGRLLIGEESLDEFAASVTLLTQDVLIQQQNSSVNDFLKDCDFKEKELFATTKQFNGTPLDKEIVKIYDVKTYHSYDDLRIALCVRGNGTLTKASPREKYLVVSKPGGSFYDYLDEGRLFLINDKDDIYDYRYHYQMTPTTADFTIGVFDNDVDLTVLEGYYVDTKSMLKDYSDLGLSIITKRDLPKYKDFDKLEQVKKSKVKNKFLEKFERVKDGKDNIKVSDLTISGDSFTYDDLSIECTNKESKRLYSQVLYNAVLDIERLTSMTELNERVNFNTLFENLCDNLYVEINSWAASHINNISCKFKVNGIPINVGKHTTEKGYVSYKINGTRINFKELSRCFARGICYQSKEDFERFIKIVSKCSLENHKYLEQGATINVTLDRTVSYIIKLKFTRKKNKNYLRIDGNDYQVKNLRGFINKLNKLNKNYWNYNGLENFCDVLDSDTYIKDDLTDEVVVSLLKDGKNAYEKAIRKSAELLDKTLKMTKAKVLNNVSIQGKRYAEAYEIQSMSGNDYVVTSSGDDGHTSNCDVYCKTGDGSYEYICIVDKSLSDQVGKDKLVNRIFALFNDRKSVGKIGTLRRHVN